MIITVVPPPAHRPTTVPPFPRSAPGTRSERNGYRPHSAPSIVQLTSAGGAQRNIRLPDLDWINDTITVTQSKTGRALQIPLTADVGNALSAYLLDERPSVDTPYVFLRCRAPFTVLSGHAACYAVLRRAFRQAGIRVGSERKGLHVLRHSAASRMLSRGVPVTTISTLLGHAHKESTDVYLATDQERMKKCALDLSLIPVNCAGLS